MTRAVAEAGCSSRERELGAIILAYNDVTERLKVAHEQLGGEVARLREELRVKNVELRRRERLAALGEMAAGLAHEVRNPLGGIALYASKLEGELADAARPRSYASRISRAVRDLDRLVSEILDFAQEDRLEVERCRLGPILDAVVETVLPWAGPRGVRVMVSPGSGDVDVACDAARLRRVLVNLLLNGVQAAPKGGHVWMSARCHSPAGESSIEVWDDGPGIAAEHLDRVFNPFFTTRASGTGLGLAIAHRIVEAHGGSIRAGPGPAGGAKFVVRLPLKGDRVQSASWEPGGTPGPSKTPVPPILSRARRSNLETVAQALSGTAAT